MAFLGRVRCAAMVENFWDDNPELRAEAEAETAKYRRQAQRPNCGPLPEDYDRDTSWAAPLPEELWPEMASEAFHGLAGQVVEAIAPTTEADPVAILAHFLVEAGNAAGRKPYCLADGARHYPNLYALLVGDTAKGRKGTAARRGGSSGS
jgi:N-acyl-D-aspartate/D-glutamate deacylase